MTVVAARTATESLYVSPWAYSAVTLSAKVVAKVVVTVSATDAVTIEGLRR